MSAQSLALIKPKPVEASMANRNIKQNVQVVREKLGQLGISMATHNQSSTPAPSVTTSTAGMKESMSSMMDMTSPQLVISVWLRTMITPAPGGFVQLDRLYKEYVKAFEGFAPKHPLLPPDNLTQLVLNSTKETSSEERDGKKGIGGMAFTTAEHRRREYEASCAQMNMSALTQQHLRNGFKVDEKVEASDQSVDAADDAPADPLSVDPKVIDPDGKYQAWIRDSFVDDSKCEIDSGDILQAFKSKFGDPDPKAFGGEPLKIAQILHLIYTVFPNAKLLTDHAMVGVGDIRWKALPEGCAQILSTCATDEGMPEWMYEEAHTLLCLTRSRRVKAWMFMFFAEEPGVSISLRSLWNFYCIPFGPAKDTHVLPDEKKFLEIVKKTFKNVEAYEVSEGHIVVDGLEPRDSSMSAQSYLKAKHDADYRMLAMKGGIDPTDPRNLFNQRLMEDPLLYRPFNSTKSPLGSQPTDASDSPMIQRLRRRAHDPPKPYGDEEPGFPGTSMKKEQRRFKRYHALWHALRKAENSFTPGTPAEWASAEWRAWRAMPFGPIDPRGLEPNSKDANDFGPV